MKTLKRKYKSDIIIENIQRYKYNSLLRPFLVLLMFISITLFVTSCMVGVRGYGYHDHRYDHQGFVDQHRNGDDRR